MTVRRPIIHVYAPSGADLVQRLGDRLVGVQVTDNPGYESDEAVITVRSKAPHAPLPPKGTIYHVTLAWAENGASFAGLYGFQRAEIRGDPEDGEEMDLICRAGDFLDTLKEVDSEYFDKENGHETAGDIIRTVAQKSGYQAIIPSDIEQVKVPYRLRWNQSRIGFLTDLADDIGAIIKPQFGKIVAMSRGAGASGSGSAMTPIVIEHDPIYSYDVSIEPRQEFKTVAAPYFDPETGRPAFLDHTTGQTKSRYAAPVLAPNKDEAERLAAAQAQQLGRYVGTGSFEKLGDPHAFAAAPVKCSGYGGDIDGIDWTAASITHDAPPESWVTTVETETKEQAQ